MRKNLRWSRIVRDFFDVISLTDVLIVWVGPRCPRCFKMGRNGYCIRTAWAPKVRGPTSKSTHVRPSSPSVWSNHILCSFYYEFSYLSNVQILLNGHVDQVFHKFCGAIPPSLMVFCLVYMLAVPSNWILSFLQRVWSATSNHVSVCCKFVMVQNCNGLSQNRC